MSILDLTVKDFDSAIANGRSFVDFWAGWCMPCKMVAPVIEELAAEHEGKVTFARVNIDDESALATRYEIMSIPTVILFKDGVEVNRVVGVNPKETYEDELQL